MIHDFSRSLHQTFLSEHSHARPDWALYHIHFKPKRNQTRDYETTFHSTGPLEASEPGSVKKLLKSYAPGEDPGFNSVDGLVDEIQRTNMPFGRTMSFEEKKLC